MRRTWFRSAVASSVALLALWPAVAGAVVTEAQVQEATGKAVTWFRAKQQPSGALGANGGLDPAWAFLGLAGAGINSADLSTGSGAPSAQDYYLGLWTGPSDNPWTSTGFPQASDYERVILLANAAGLDPLRLSAGQNLLAKLAHFHHGGYFGLKGTFNQTMFGLLALDGLPVPGWLTEQVAQNIEANAHEDGGYTFSTVESQAAYERPGEVDLTGAAIAALCGAGRTSSSPSVAKGIAFLEGKRSPNGQIGNVDSTSWALDGLGACGIERGAPGWTAGDEQTVEWLLSQQSAEGAWPSNGIANYYATQDALRAIVNPGFTAGPPLRLDPGLPARRLPSPVPAGTSVPVVLAINSGFGSIQLCSTTALPGATLTEVLAAARAQSDPAGCVSQFKVGAEGVTSINGAVAEAGSGGGWKFSLDGGAEQAAVDQTVAWGQVVGLRLEHPSALIVSETGLEFEPATVGEAGGSLGATLTNHTAGAVNIEAPVVSGPARGDYSIAAESCGGQVLSRGSSCAVTVTFTPGAAGERSATLEIPVEGREAVEVALRGEGTLPPQGHPTDTPPDGPPTTDTPPGTTPTAPTTVAPPATAAPKTSAPGLQGITRLSASGLQLSVSASGTITIRISRAVGVGRHRHWQKVKTLSVKAAKAGQVTARFPELPPGRYRVTVALPDGSTLNRNLTIPTRKASHA